MPGGAAGVQSSAGQSTMVPARERVRSRELLRLSPRYTDVCGSEAKLLWHARRCGASPSGNGAHGSCPSHLFLSWGRGVLLPCRAAAGVRWLLGTKDGAVAPSRQCVVGRRERWCARGRRATGLLPRDRDSKSLATSAGGAHSRLHGGPRSGPLVSHCAAGDAGVPGVHCRGNGAAGGAPPRRGTTIASRPVSLRLSPGAAGSKPACPSVRPAPSHRPPRYRPRPVH
mmetsp:Transcript_26532/g.74149  ORF Transcript_26532/g.74149 Transcript_26532/m.74149 type:complete len:227 (+) Transcript_26532:1415-2095(+)